ncbi:transport and Golgi organization protein 2 isoform X1 [Neodiprion lecontei]|uniref:Transport and Golgi organization protein 2 isoform X1 n=1 Tax=Neodiprion lecontei TaxID=441921 RepID=A0A6J0BFZ8_NEOLC|nr:transport and Golgi organization protein 2 isoform X1 [Neodiprion lecontei]
MCIMFIYRNAEAKGDTYRIILASNRDESLKRPTATAHWWKNYPRCLGGVDMEPGKEGGTWLALSTEGRFGALLNLTGEKRSTTTPGEGRGYLVKDYIISDVSADKYLANLYEKNRYEQIYNPFNLILVNLWNTHVSLLCSAENSEGPEKCLDTILGFGNSPTGRPLKKVTLGKERFKNIVQDATILDQDKIIENLIEFLRWNEKHLPDPELESRAPNWYKDLSSVFVHIQDAEYGTRAHSILMVDGSNRLTFVEETLTPDASWKRQTFTTELQIFM